MTDQEWHNLEDRYGEGEITSKEFIEATEGQEEHPEWWDNACLCNLCLSYGT